MAEPSNPDREVMDRFDAFFGRGEHTERISNFMEEQRDKIQEVVAAEEISTDSHEGIVAFDLYRRFSVLIEDIVSGFVEEEAKDGRTTDLQTLGELVLEEWSTPEGQIRFLCTAYVVAAIDFESFVELIEEVCDVEAFSVENDDGCENVVAPTQSS